MINLLPPQAKRRLNKEYRLRFGIVVLWAVLILELLAVLLFLPSFVTLKTSTDQLSQDLEAKKNLSQSGTATSSKEVTLIKRELASLRIGTTATDTPPSIVFTEVLKSKPRGIEISALAYQLDKSGISVQLTGVANTREDILAYKNALGTNPHLVLAKANDGYILKKTNITFSLTLSYK